MYVEGKLDLQDSEVAREAWRSMKNDAFSLSFGYVTLQTRKRGGINDLLELDLFEVSIVPHPANPDTRVLSMKAAVAERRVPTDADLRQQAKALGIEPPLTRRQLRLRSDEIALEHALGWQPPRKVTPEPAESVPTAGQQRRQWHRLRLELLTDDLDPEAIEAARDDPALPTDAQLRERAKALGLAVPPPRRHPKLHRHEGPSQAPNADALRTGRQPMNTSVCVQPSGPCYSSVPGRSPRSTRSASSGWPISPRLNPAPTTTATFMRSSTRSSARSRRCLVRLSDRAVGRGHGPHHRRPIWAAFGRFALVKPSAACGQGRDLHARRQPETSSAAARWVQKSLQAGSSRSRQRRQDVRPDGVARRGAGPRLAVVRCCQGAV